MVIPQVFGSSSVLYRVAVPLFAYSALCECLVLRGVRGDALHDQCKRLVKLMQRHSHWRLTRACAEGIGSSDISAGMPIAI